jgi:hypothetical protein
MIDGSTFYTPMYFNEHASDSILSPEAICFASGGLLSKWSQSGSPDDSTGRVSFYDNKGTEVISLTLNKRNGLYYTPVTSVAVNRTEQHNKLGTCYLLLPRHFNPSTSGVFIRREPIANSVAARGHLRERLSPSRITPG